MMEMARRICRNNDVLSRQGQRHFSILRRCLGSHRGGRVGRRDSQGTGVDSARREEIPNFQDISEAPKILTGGRPNGSFSGFMRTVKKPRKTARDARGLCEPCSIFLG